MGHFGVKRREAFGGGVKLLSLEAFGCFFDRQAGRICLMCLKYDFLNRFVLIFYVCF
jgi:hypothetical protein